jgi:AraC-like DNA-binding protein
LPDSSYIGLDERIYPTYKAAALVRYMEGRGRRAEETLAGSGLEVAALNDPRARLSRQQLLTVFRNVLELAPSRSTALEAGSKFHITSYGFYGYALMSSATVRDAIEFGIEYRQLATPTMDMTMSTEGDDATWKFTPLPELPVEPLLQRFICEFQSGLHLALHRMVIGPEFRFRSVQFAFAAPQQADLYHQTFECPIQFGAQSSELHFDSQWLERALPGANRMTHQMVKELCDELILKIGTGYGVAGDIYRRVIAQPGKFPRLDEMSEQLAASPRTLRRQLRSEGRTYQQIVDEVRQQLAMKYLKETEMTHGDIAERLGYSDASNFRRAFKRWARQSPNEFRKDS